MAAQRVNASRRIRGTCCQDLEGVRKRHILRIKLTRKGINGAGKSIFSKSICGNEEVNLQTGEPTPTCTFVDAMHGGPGNMDRQKVILKSTADP